MTPTHTRTRRGWALVGALGGLVGLVGLFTSANLTGNVGDLFVDNAQLVAAIADERAYVWLHQVVCAVAAVGVVVFAAGLRRHLVAQEPAGSLVPAVATAGLGLVTVALLIGGSVSTELFFALGEIERWDPDSIASLVETYNTVAWLWSGVGLTAGAVAWGGFRHGSVSRWFAAFSAIVAFLVAVTQALPQQYIALVPGALWVLVAGLAFAAGARRQASR